MIVKQSKDKPRLTIRSSEFRNIVADTFGVRANDNLVQIMFSLDTGDFQTGEPVYLEEMLVSLPPKALKVLSIVLSNTVKVIEAASGQINLPAHKEQELDKAMDKALAAIKESQRGA